MTGRRCFVSAIWERSIAFLYHDPGDPTMTAVYRSGELVVCPTVDLAFAVDCATRGSWHEVDVTQKAPPYTPVKVECEATLLSSSLSSCPARAMRLREG